jgi:hypothetical protein
MENEIEQILKEQILKLPREVTRFLASADWTEILEKIAASYNLSGEETAQFKNETVLVIAGLVHPDAYPETLGAVLGVNPTLTEVITAVEKEIFAPLRPHLIKFFEEERAHSGEHVPEKQIASPVGPAEIPSPWTIGTELAYSEKTAPVPAVSAANLAPVTPPTPPKPSPAVPPPNLPGEELVWTPRILADIPPAQPLPQTFDPIGKKTSADIDKGLIRPFEKTMRDSGMLRRNPEDNPETTKLPDTMPAALRRSGAMFEPATVLSNASRKPMGTPAPGMPNPVPTTVVAPVTKNAGADPYREPLE